MNSTIVYVDAGDYREFLNFQKSNPDYRCVFIYDERALRGRQPGLIKRVGRFEERWNYVGITEAIDRAEKEWEEYIKDTELKEELQQGGLTDEDLQYGIN